MNLVETPRSVALELEGLQVVYPGKPTRVAVADATFRMERGSSVALVGPSGSGKSSLLLAIAGVLPSQGVLRADGADLHALPPHRRDIGLVFQDGQLFPHRNVAGNVGFGLEMQRVAVKERDERVGALLDLVGLGGFGERSVSELSGGERQRVALARALAPQPRLVLLDEPLSSLDAELRTRLAQELPALLASVGATWIMVTHDMDEAHAMADRTLTMRNGVVTPDSKHA